MNLFPTFSTRFKDGPAGVCLRLQMGDDTEQPPCSVAGKADNRNAEESVLDIFNHAVQCLTEMCSTLVAIVSTM